MQRQAGNPILPPPPGERIYARGVAQRYRKYVKVKKSREILYEDKCHFDPKSGHFDLRQGQFDPDKVHFDTYWNADKVHFDLYRKKVVWGGE
jgi:hypothetical protein